MVSVNHQCLWEIILTALVALERHVHCAWGHFLAGTVDCRDGDEEVEFSGHSKLSSSWLEQGLYDRRELSDSAFFALFGLQVHEDRLLQAPVALTPCIGGTVRQSKPFLL